MYTLRMTLTEFVPIVVRLGPVVVVDEEPFEACTELELVVKPS